MERIYLDHISSKPIDPRVLEFAKGYLEQTYGNPSSLHSVGLEAKRAIEDARGKVAELINAEKDNTIVFTASATEANNLAIRGTAMRNIRKGKDVAASAIEHISVLNPLKELQKNGFTFNLIPVDSTGLVDLEKLEEGLTEHTIITSIAYANNEIGTIQPIREISERVHRRGMYLHVDATAAAAYIPIDVKADGIDLLTLSSNDLSGPQGAGALYIKPSVKLQPLLLGGGQERGLRSGTENLFAIAGMGEAARIVMNEMTEESQRLREMRDRVIDGILGIEGSHLTGHPTQRLPYHASFRFDQIEGESILLNMDRYGIQVSTGSACSSKTLEPSHVLLAIGLSHEQAHGSMVLSLGRSSKIEQISAIVEAARETVERLRMLSPLSRKEVR
jgi:cysteine desulfurase